jgi:hypothetical protein
MVHHELFQTGTGNKPDEPTGPVADAEKLWSWAMTECLPSFGPYEDAMSQRSRSLFHTRISSLVNIHRLLPSRLISEVAGMKLSLESKEGFIRQILGWREFVRHVHEATDGFRRLPAGKTPVEKVPGDGGYRRWVGNPGSPAKKSWQWTEAHPLARWVVRPRCLPRSGVNGQGWPAWTRWSQMCGPKDTAITSRGS